MSVKILVVDDTKHWHFRWREELGDKVLIVSAFSIEEAREHFAANPDIVAIVMDACVPGDRPTTLPLVEEFRRTFKGPIVAVSSIPSYRKQLVIVGCDYESDKDYLSSKILKILSL